MQQKRRHRRHVSRRHHEWFQKNHCRLQLFVLPVPARRHRCKHVAPPVTAKHANGSSKNHCRLQLFVLSIPTRRRHPCITVVAHLPADPNKHMPPVPAKIFACHSFPSHHARLHTQLTAVAAGRRMHIHHLTVATSLTGGCSSRYYQLHHVVVPPGAAQLVRSSLLPVTTTPRSHLQPARRLPPAFTLAATASSDTGRKGEKMCCEREGEDERNGRERMAGGFLMR